MQAGETRKSVVGLWFRFLKIAMKLGLPIDWEFYREWGSQKEIEDATFAGWWKSRGSQLFERAQPRIRVSVEGADVVVTIPRDYTIRAIRKDIGPLVKTYLTRGDAGGGARFVTAGVVRYDDLARYVRLLDIQLREQGSLAMKNKVTLLEADYAKWIGKAQKQNATMKARQRTGKRIKKTKLPKQPKLTVRAAREAVKRARRIAENVAGGVFPGSAYRSK
jgi:hypothetical protein